MKKSILYKLRQLIEKAAASLPDIDALDGAMLFPSWKAGIDVAIGDRLERGGKLYKCLQPHTTAAEWPPEATPALWTEVARPGEIPVWRQPVGVQDAYMSGDKVWFPEKDTTVYTSLIDNNVWSPEAYPDGWEAEE